jgi:succinate dehydrogenase/fumarate reductase flavoprotein subunit
MTMSIKDAKQTIETDVLVIGSGMAGLRAAIEARRSGLEVLLLDKSLLGRASSSIYAGGLGLEILPKHLPYHGASKKKFASYFNGTIEEIFKKMLIDGVSIGWGYPYIDNQRILMTVACDYKLRQEELRDFGVEDPYSQHFIGRPVSMGVPIILPMIAHFKKIGGKSKEKTMITDLIRQGNRIVGAIGFELDRKRFTVILAKATIIATGGCAQVYKRTYSPTRITGDGYAMAYRAGAELWEMELVAFCNWTIAEPKCPQWWIPFSYGRVSGKLRNALGEPFFEKYAKRHGWLGPKATLNDEDVMDVRYGKPLTELDHHFWRACSMEIREGRGEHEAVCLDLRDVPEDRWYYENDGIAALNEMRNFDWKKKPLHIAPGAEKQAGGINTDEYFKTNLEGLYACGEAGPGVSLPFCIVSGASSGRYAAWYAREATPVGLLSEDKKWIEKKQTEARSLFGVEPTQEGNVRDIRRDIKEVMWKYVGTLRTDEELKKGLQELDRIEKERIPKLYARDPRELRESYEVINMVLVGKMIAESARFRTESRGLHQRLDFPEEDNLYWLKNVILHASEGGMRLVTRPVNLIWDRPESSEERG